MSRRVAKRFFIFQEKKECTQYRGERKNDDDDDTTPELRMRANIRLVKHLYHKVYFLMQVGVMMNERFLIDPIVNSIYCAKSAE